jgi:lipoprotein-anchoring transpeptidase ErfK/SrfK
MADPQDLGRAARRHAERRRRRVRAGIAGLAAVALAVGAVLAFSGGEVKKRAHREPPSTTTTTQKGQIIYATATTKVPKLVVYKEPRPDAELLAELPATTAYRAKTTLLVDSYTKRPEGDVPDWLPVTVPLKKPNNMPGWIKKSDVAITLTSYEIRVHLFFHTLDLVLNDKIVFSTKVILGTAETPTPTGTFYVTDPVNCNTESVPGYPVGQCSGAYGAFAMGTSALSEKLDSFAGTIPQIALHGTSLPDSELGKNLSNGCIRMPNDAILKLAKIVPLLGTPVIITNE